MSGSATPWREWLHAAYHMLGIRPEEFWRMTLPELMALMSRAVTAAMSRAEFEEMCKRFPD